MSSLIDEYTKNKSPEDKKEIERRVREMGGNMSELSALMLVLEEMRKEKAKGGIMRLGFRDGPSLESILENDPLKDGVPMKKDGFFISPDFNKMTPEQKKLYKLRMEIMKKGFEKKLSPEGLEKLKIQRQIRDQQRKDRGLPESIELMADGGRIGFQDGTPDRELYETPVTDAIKSVNEKTIDAIQKGGELFDKYSGIDQITSSNFPGAFDEASGQPSDFRHQAASNLLAEALGKGQYTDPILGPISYLSGAVGASGLGAIKEIGDLAAALYDNPKNYKDAFSEFVKDNVSNIKGAFAKDKTSEELYDKLMAGYEPIDPFGMNRISVLRSQQLFAQRKKAIEDAKKKQKDTIAPPQKSKKIKTTTTKPGTGGGGDFTPTTTAQNVARTASRVDPSGNVKAYGLAKGGLAAMLGEFDDRVTFQGGGRDASQSDFDTPSNNNTGDSSNREVGIMSRGLGPKGTTGNIGDFNPTGPDDRSTPEQKARHNLAVDLARGIYNVKRPNIVNRLMRNPIFRTLLYTTNPFEVGRKALNVYDLVTGTYDDVVNPELGDITQ